MHKLLKRQLDKYFGKNMPDHVGFEAFVAAVGNAYAENEKRLRNMENVIDVASNEALTELQNIRFAIEEASLVVIIGCNGRIISINKNLQQLIGHDAGVYIQKSVFEIAGKEQQQLISQAIDQLKRGNIWQGELFIKTKTGKTCWMNGTITALKNEAGAITRYIGILYDITSRKLFEEEIISSEKKYRAVINDIQDIIFQTDRLLDFTFLNRAWQVFSGYEIRATLGNNIINYIHPDDHAQYLELVNGIQNNYIRSGNALLKMKTTAGFFKWVELTLNGNFSIHDELISYSGTIRDITENRKKEDLLARSNAFQNALLDAAHHAIISTDSEGYIITFNRGAENLTGHAAAKMIGNRRIQELFINHTKSVLHQLPSDLMLQQKENKNQEIECRIANATTHEIDVAVSISKILEPHTESSNFLFIIHDISSRKSAEAEVGRLSTILEESPDYVSYYDMAGAMIYANKAFREIRQSGPEETSCNDLYPDWAELIVRRKAIPYALEHGMWKGETAILDAGGNEIPVHQLINVHLDTDGRPSFLSSIMRDITQRKQYEYKLLQSEKRNRDLINYSQAIIATHDLEGHILTINPAGCTLLEYSLEDMVGKKIVDFMPTNQRELFKSEYLQNFERSKAAEGILTLLSKSGKSISLLYKNYRVDEKGADSYIIGFAQDISERLMAESELKTAKLVAEESAKTKEMFLANMSHEIRTPMNGIVGLTNLLLKSPLNVKQKEYAESVKHSAENLLVIINDILDFSKIEAGKFELNKKPFLLTTLFYNLQQAFKTEAHQKGLELQLSIDDLIFHTLVSDEIRLNQILSNLVSNALKFTEKGKIILSAELLTQTAEACRIRISVADSGIGIAPEKLDKIFNSFTQANSDTSRKYGGTGLGLSIVKSLLELFGSSIKVISAPEQGSTFYFDINLEKGTKLLRENENKEEDYSGQLKGIRILMAEDNKVNQLFASELLQDWGARLDIAENGRQAVELAECNEYDLILMDIQMPEMSGLDATNYIRTSLDDTKKGMVIIAMTANAMKGNETVYSSAGMNDVIFKPYEARELFHTICRHVPALQPKPEPHPDILSATPANDPLTSQSSEKGIQLKHASMHVLTAFSRGKNSFILKMLNVLIDSIPITANELRTAIANEDWDLAGKAAHKLIPNMNMMGNESLERQMKWVENQANNTREQHNIINSWKTIEEELLLAMEDLEAARKYYRIIETS